MPLEKPELKLKFELTLPDFTGAPPQKYSVSRTLKAKWSDNPKEISANILEEIKNYKGSFVGDTIHSLHRIVQLDGAGIKENAERTNDITRYAAALIETLIFSGVQDKLHTEVLKEPQLSEWDGSIRDIDIPTSDELKDVDIEKVMMLLAPKIKHVLFLISKDLKKKNT